MKKEFKAGCPACFKALSTKVRAKIIDLLRDGREKSVMEIVGHFKLRQPTISYHLSELERAGLLLSRESGRQVFYRQNPTCAHDGETCLLR